MKSLWNKIVAPLMVVGLGLFGKAQAQDPVNVYNPFFPPNEVKTETEAYGRPDIDKDGDEDWDDYNLIVAGHRSDQSDIDGKPDGPIEDDLSLFEKLLNGEISHFPGDWKHLITRQERESWFTNVYKIDKVDDYAWTNTGDPETRWDSGNFLTQFRINTWGYDIFAEGANPIPAKYDTTKNGRFNLPVYGVIVNAPGWNHAMNAILVGDNPKNFNDWLFYEPQTDEIVELGSVNIPYNSKVSIIYFNRFKEPPSENIDKPFYRTLLYFNVDATGNPSFGEAQEGLIGERPTVGIKDELGRIPKFFSLKQNHPNPFNPNTTIPYTLDRQANISLDLFDIKGHLIENINIGYMNIGSHQIQYNSKKLPSGIYFYQLSVDGTLSKPMKMTVLK